MRQSPFPFFGMGLREGAATQSVFTLAVDEEGKAIGAEPSKPRRAPIDRSLTTYTVSVGML